MRLRPATSEDLQRLTEITTSSLVDDPTYDYLWPKRKDYPEVNSLFLKMKLEKHLYDERTSLLVVELGHDELKLERMKADHNPVPAIVSYAVWERFGNDASAARWIAAKNTWSNVLGNATAKYSRWSVAQIYQRHDGDDARMAAVTAETRKVKAKFFSDADNWWSMELLVTDRPFRRRGAATMLVKWGIAQARAEHVFCGVEASPMGVPVYAAAGFIKLAHCIVQVPRDPESLEYDVMRWEPKKYSAKSATHARKLPKISYRKGHRA